MTPKRIVSGVQEHLRNQGRSRLAAGEWIYVMLVCARLGLREAQSEVFVSTTLDLRDGQVIPCRAPAFVHEAIGPFARKACI